MKVQGMAKQQQLVTDQTRMGMIFAETDDDLAYLVFIAPDYPERVAKQLVDKHARAVESMAGDGARRLAPRPSSPRGKDCCRVRRLTRPLWGWTVTHCIQPACHRLRGAGATIATVSSRCFGTCSSRWLREMLPSRHSVSANSSVVSGDGKRCFSDGGSP